MKVRGTTQIIENALSIYPIRLCPTFEQLFTGARVGRKAQNIGKGHNTVYEIDSWGTNPVKVLRLKGLFINYVTH